MKKIVLILVLLISFNITAQDTSEKRYFGFYFMSGLTSNIMYKDLLKTNDFTSIGLNVVTTNTISLVNKDNFSVVLLNNAFNFVGIWLSNKLLNDYYKPNKAKLEAKAKIDLIYD